MNILSDGAIHSCTSCQVCSAVCPASAISVRLDEYGFYRPVVDVSKCVDCGKCVGTCYKFDNNICATTAEKLDNYRLYAARAKCRALVEKTTSGGIADVLARQLIRDGYKVIGVVYDGKRQKAYTEIANTEAETVLFRGSKYIQSFSESSLKEIISHHKDFKYAVFGLPCLIYALSKWCNQMHIRDKFVLIDLFCHGCPSMNLWNKMLEHLVAEGKTVDYADFRSKRKGWGVYSIDFSANGKRLFSTTPFKDYFYELFFSNKVLNEACLDCRLRGTFEYSDIRLGDFWGDRYKADVEGVSAVSVMTPIGASLFDRIKSDIVFKPSKFEELLPYQSWNSIYDVDIEDRKAILNMLREDGDIKYISRYVRVGTVKECIKTVVRQFVFLQPLPLISVCKKIIYGRDNVFKW